VPGKTRRLRTTRPRWILAIRRKPATRSILCDGLCWSSLDPSQASRLYDALVADDPQFAAGVQALLTLIEQRKIDPLQLQHVLDSEHFTLAALPRKIATAWYIGVVGDGEQGTSRPRSKFTSGDQGCETGWRFWHLH
jgi:Membrane bound FAD containing D-sorbitol dehydrogenase